MTSRSVWYPHEGSGALRKRGLDLRQAVRRVLDVCSRNVPVVAPKGMHAFTDACRAARWCWARRSDFPGLIGTFGPEFGFRAVSAIISHAG